MSDLNAETRCPDPRLRSEIPEFCFGELEPAQRDALALHLIECPTCAEQVRRLTDCIDAARFDPRVKPLPVTPAILSLFGLAGRFERAFGGHVRFVLAFAALYALLFAVPVLVEIAYRWDEYGGAALRLSLMAFAWVFVTTVLAFWVQARGLQNGRGGLGLAVLAGATILLTSALLPFFPVEPVTEARFNTYPTKLAYLKAVFQAWMVGPVFGLWTFHAVVSVQRELSLGRHRRISALLQGDRTGTPVQGLRVPTVGGLGIYFGALTAYNAIGLSHLFDNLLPNPHIGLFMFLVAARSTTWFLLPALCLWWYWGRVDDLKREASAVATLARGPNYRL